MVGSITALKNPRGLERRGVGCSGGARPAGFLGRKIADPTPPLVGRTARDCVKNVAQNNGDRGAYARGPRGQIMRLPIRAGGVVHLAFPLRGAFVVLCEVVGFKKGEHRITALLRSTKLGL